MEMQLPYILMLVSLFFFFSTLILFIYKSKNSAANLPPGPRKLPLIGNLHNLIGSAAHRAMHQLAQKYGPLMHLQLGQLSVVVVSSPGAAKQIMKTHDVNFASRPRILVTEVMSYNYTSISFSPPGDYWRRLRKICTQELLTAKRVQSFQSLREEIFLDVMRWIGSMEGSRFNLTEKFYSSTYAIVVRAVVGKITKERERLLPVIQETVEFVVGFSVAEVYPSIKLFQRMSRERRRLTELHGEADKILEDIICEHKVANSVKSDDDERNKLEDLVDVLLKYQDEGLEHSLTNSNIKAVVLDILTGGSETSGTTMDWAMAEMLKNPNILAKAQREVRKVFDSKGYVDESCIHELKYLKAIVKETLRMHPPVPLLLPRKCGETCEIDGYQIPANTKVIVNSWAINRDSNYWKDADCFMPERFLDSLVDFRGNHFEFIPFGAGRRMCPGISFGIATVELPLAMLLYHFDWDLPAGENRQDLVIEKSFGAAATRAKDMYVVAVIKRPLPLPTVK